MDLVVEIYRITEMFPKSELYGIVSQMRRSAVSIPSNIAEGRKRRSKKDFCHFLTVSYSSTSELETQIEIAKRLHFVSVKEYVRADTLLLEVLKMLNKMLSSLSS